MYLTTEAIKQLVQNSVKTGDTFPVTFMDIPSLMKEGSYLFYEFEDKEVTKNFDENRPEYGTYTKYISPLFSESVINEKSNEELLSIITEETPFYHLEPAAEVSAESEFVSSTRDTGINDVPAALQTSEFYNTWFRESQGYIQNYVLLDVYNKLRWPFINENQYLNASLFPYLASNAFNIAEDSASLIEFRDSAAENEEDNNFYEGQNDTTEVIAEKDRVYSKVGCIDYLNDVVNQKLSSIYSFVDYDPEQSNLLSNWTESLYESGAISVDYMSTQISIYKLQDLKYELLRRKFAGSSTLYKLALASVDRQGSFISTTSAGSLASSSSIFKDKRLIRLLNIPGILSQQADLTDINPIDTFYSLPKEENENYIPLDTLVPLFYTSAFRGFSSYSAEEFYVGNKVQEYRNNFLRDNSTVIEWTAPQGLVSTKSINTIYPTLDEKIASAGSESGFRYRTLDDTVLKDESDTSSGTIPLYLDREKPLVSSSMVSGNVLDISANRLLFNSNTLQQDLGDNYPYLTYPIANNNSVGLMDLPWIEYLEESTEKKSRVQDNVSFGVQLSRYVKLDGIQTGRYTFFGISYGIDTEDEEGTPYTTLTLPKLSYDESLRIKAKVDSIFNRECASGEVASSDKLYYKKEGSLYVLLNPQPEEGVSVEGYYTLPAFYKKTFDSYEEVSITEGDNVYSLYILQEDQYIPCKDIAEVEYPRFAYLWYCVLKYSAAEFDPDSLTTTLISRITLRVSAASKYSESEAYQELVKFNEGILPFTYSEIKDDRVLDLKLGVFTETVVDVDNVRRQVEAFHDDLSYGNYTKAAFIFSTSDIVKNTDLLDTSPESVSSAYLSLSPSPETKALFYTIYKGSTNGIAVYKWSEPIKVTVLDQKLLSSFEEIKADPSLQSKIKPDWHNLGYYLNPYLNFTTNSASPLRYKVSIPSLFIKDLDIPEESKEKITTGPSENAGLSNLTRVRGYECACNDDGRITLPMKWALPYNEEAQDIFGFYLNRNHPKTDEASTYPEFVQIYGDNREDDIFEPAAADLDTEDSRTSVKYNLLTKMPCLEFRIGTATKDSYPVAENYLQLLPAKYDYLYSYKKTRTKELEQTIYSSEESLSGFIDEFCKDVPAPADPGTPIDEKVDYQINWILDNTVISKEEVTSTKRLRTASEQKAVRKKITLDSYKEELSHIDDHTDEEREKEAWEKWWWNRPADGITVCANIIPRNGEYSTDPNDLLSVLEEEGSVNIVSRVNSSPIRSDVSVLPYNAAAGTYYKVLHAHDVNPAGYYYYDGSLGWVFTSTEPPAGTNAGIADFYNVTDRENSAEEIIDSEFSLDLVKKNYEDVENLKTRAEAELVVQRAELSEVRRINEPKIQEYSDEIEAANILVDGKQTEIVLKNNELSSLEEQLAENQKSLNELNLKLTGANSYAADQAQWSAEVAELEPEIEELIVEKNILQSEIDSLQIDLKNATSEEEKERIREEISLKEETLGIVISSLETKQTLLAEDNLKLEGASWQSIPGDPESVDPDRLTALEAEIDRLEDVIADINDQISNITDEIAQLQEDLADLEAGIADLQIRKATLEKEISDLAYAVSATEEKILKLLTELEELRNHAIVTVVFTFYPYGNSTQEVWTIESDDILNHNISGVTAFPDYNLRIAASTKTEKTLTGTATTLSLIVNNKVTTPIIYNAAVVESTTLKYPEGNSFNLNLEEGEFLPGYPVKYFEGSSLGGIDVAGHTVLGVTHRGIEYEYVDIPGGTVKIGRIYIDKQSDSYYRWNDEFESYIQISNNDVIEVTEDESSPTLGLPTTAEMGKVYKLIAYDTSEEISRTRYYEATKVDCSTLSDYTQLEQEIYLESHPVIQQVNRYLGSIFDLRLYNEGFTDLGLQMISIGTMRELYSYSPSNYRLGYHTYEDLTIFKEVARRPVDVNMVPINSIRIFNRSVWDSAFIDMYPVSEEESTADHYQSRPDYMDPQDDLDIYGVVNGEWVLKDCIEQVLENVAEVTNGASPLSGGTDICRINYNNELYDINATDITSVASVTLYPVVYDKDPFMSVDVDFEFLDENCTILATKEEHEIRLPAAVDPSDGVLGYNGDISLNWTISPESDFSIWYSHGSHIALSYNSLLDTSVAVYSMANTESSTDKSSNSQTNHILIPLTVPRQIDIESGSIGYFDRLNLRGVQVNNGLSTLLKATTYYNEIRIPVRCTLVDDNHSYSYQYASKWDAIRTLKEGTYYITCKYPFQILPFVDYLYDVNANTKYASLYASARFKIEVYGTPVKYQLDRNNAEDIRTDFRSDFYSTRITNYLKSSAALVNPIDNRSFPHRNINIDLYVQDCEGIAGQMRKNNASGEGGSATEAYTFTWKLLGTNHPDDFNNSDSLIYLTEDALKDGLVLEQNIPLFFSKNYTAPFFIAKSEKTSSGDSIINSASADDDLIEPIRINPKYGTFKIVSFVPASGIALAGVTYYSDTTGTIADPQPNYLTEDSVDGYYTKVENLDNLEAKTEHDLDNLVIAAGRSYKLLWDYTASLCEFSFTDNVYGLESDAQKELISSTGLPAYTMTNSEKINFSRLVNILDSSNPAEYMYTTDGLNYHYNDPDIQGKLNGYYIDDSEYHEVTLYSTNTNPTPEELIEDYSADTGYRECTVLDYNEYKTQAGEVDIVYLDKSDPSSYKYYIYDPEVVGSNKYVRVLPENLDVSTVGTLGTYYIYRDNIEKVFTAVIILNNAAFYSSSSQTYWVWNQTKYEEATVHTVTEYGYFPYPGVTNDLYEDESTGILYKCINTVPHFIDVSSTGATPFYFGNPYSRSSEHNYLLRVKNEDDLYSRHNLSNSYYFAYVPTEVPSNNTTVNGHIITTKLPAIKSNLLDAVDVTFNEASVILSQYKYMSGIANSAISLITGNIEGIFTALSKVRPEYTYSTSSTVTVAENSYVRSVSDTLHAYYASDRVIPSKNTNIIITRRGLYSNNLLINQDFDNNSAWHWRNADSATYKANIYDKTYVSDEDWDGGLGKDVCELSYQGLLNNGDLTRDNSEDPLLMEYSTGSALISASYEAAISVKVSPSEARPEKFYRWFDNSESYELIDELDIISIDNGLLPEEGQEGKLYLFRPTSSSYIWMNGTGGAPGAYFTIPMKPYDPDEEGEEEVVYVDNATNLVDIYICYLHKNALVGEPYKLEIDAIAQDTAGLLYSTATFTDRWYVFSKELTAPVRADHVAFMFVCHDEVTLRFTKAVIRKSDSVTHALGLSDGRYTKATAGSAATVSLSSHRVVVFKNNETNELLPIQFENTIFNRPGTNSYDGSSVSYAVESLSDIKDFIMRYSLGFPTSNSKLEDLYEPWTRRIHYKRSLTKNYVSGYLYDEEFWEDLDHSVFIERDSTLLYKDIETDYYYVFNTILNKYEITEPFEETAYFNRYETQSDRFGIKKKAENTVSTNDIYASANISYSRNSSSDKRLSVNALVFNTNETSFLNTYNTNMKITTEYLTDYSGTIIANGPVTLENETLSMLTNSFDPERFKAGANTSVVTTNIQLMSEPDETTGLETILYELEFLPIIYDEKKHHFSANIFIHKTDS